MRKCLQDPSRVVLVQLMHSELGPQLGKWGCEQVRDCTHHAMVNGGEVLTSLTFDSLRSFVLHMTFPLKTAGTPILNVGF